MHELEPSRVAKTHIKQAGNVPIATISRIGSASACSRRSSRCPIENDPTTGTVRHSGTRRIAAALLHVSSVGTVY